MLLDRPENGSLVEFPPETRSIAAFIFDADGLRLDREPQGHFTMTALLRIYDQEGPSGVRELIAFGRGSILKLSPASAGRLHDFDAVLIETEVAGALDTEGAGDDVAGGRPFPDPIEVPGGSTLHALFLENPHAAVALLNVGPPGLEAGGASSVRR